MPEWWRKVTAMLYRGQLDAELQEEMQTHLRMKIEAGAEPLPSRRQFGNVTQLLEDSRAEWGWPRLEGWLRDFRHALRGSVRRPGFTVTVVLTLALGIGAGNTIFSLVDTVLLRPLPYPDPDRLADLQETKKADQNARTRVSPGRLEDWNRLNRSFEALAGSYTDTLTETTREAPQRLSAAFVSPRFFAVLATPPALGRVLTPEEEQFGGANAAVISDAFWRRRFGAEPTVLGSTIVVSDQNYVVVGVMPPAFQYPTPTTELWIPKQARPGLMEIREARFYSVLGRLKRGVTLEQARTDLAGVQDRLGVMYPKTDAGWSVAMEPLKERLVGRSRLALLLLLVSAGLLLLITYTNVACLLLVRLNSRIPEIATRHVLGATRAAIARRLFTEGLLYASLGGLLGIAAAVAGIPILRQQLAGIPRITELAIDARVLAVAAGVSVTAAVLCSLAPILRSVRGDLRGALSLGARSLIGGRQRLTRILVSAQFALATTLMIGAGLLIRSLLQLQEAPLGFRPANVLTLRVGASFNEAPDAAVQRHLRMLDKLSSVPGVTAVAMSAGLPGVNPAWPREFEIEGEREPDGSLRFATWRVVTAGYFETLGIPILEGQTCRMTTGSERPFEVLVNRRFAERYFPGRNPLGRSIRQGPQGDSGARVVGVVTDVREDGHGVEPQPLVYACGFLRYWPDSDILVQTENPAALANAVQQAIREIEPARPIYSVRPLASALEGALAQTRFRTFVITLFSVFALTLAAVGLYGVMACLVAQRRREIGIRAALGARPDQILREILRSGAGLAGAGAAAGVVLAAAVSRMLKSLLFEVSGVDLSTYLLTVAVLFGTALLASLIPGRRATSVPPTEALREQ